MWIKTSRTLNQPMRIILSLTVQDLMGLLFGLGFLQIFALVVGIDNLYVIIFVLVQTVTLVFYRYRHKEGIIYDSVISYYVENFRGGVFYEPKVNRRKKI